MKKQFIEAGKIVASHGLKGEVRIAPWCDSADFLCQFKRLYYADGAVINVKSARVHKNIVIALFEGINDVQQANMLRDKVIYINRDDVRLPEGTNFIQDLIGLKVIDAENGKEYGSVTDVLATGANDVYQVTKDGKNYYVPVIPDVVVEKNVDEGYIKIKVLEGIFDDEN